MWTNHFKERGKPAPQGSAVGTGWVFRKHQEGWEAEAEAEGGEQQGETVWTQVIGVRR